ncbi:MAG: hypothetical protein ACT6QS_03310 [Flavobacteriales bacterium]
MIQKRIVFAGLMLMTLCLLLPSCKKDDPTYSYHIFWFDKNTSDSLLAHGYERLLFSYTISPAPSQTSPGHFTLLTMTATEWLPKAPDSTDNLAIKIGMHIPEGDQRSVNYLIGAVPPGVMSFSEADAAHLEHATGSFTLTPDYGIHNTQLIWKP